MTRALALLDNNKTIVVAESKGGLGSEMPKYIFDADALFLARGMFKPNATYGFKLNKASTSSTGTSVWQVNIATDLTVFNEGATLAALFDEVKLVGTCFRWSQLNVPGGTHFNFFIGYTPVVYATTPTAAVVSRMPFCILSGSNWPSTGRGMKGDVISASVKGRTWGACTDEGVSTPRIVSGLNGTFSIAHSTAPNSSGAVFISYWLQTRAMFRNRG